MPHLSCRVTNSSNMQEEGGGLRASESEPLRLRDPGPPGRVILIRPGLLLESTLWRPASARSRWTWTQRYLQQEPTLCMGSVQRPPLCPGTEQRHAAGGRAPPRAGQSLTPAAALLKTHLQRPATRSALAWEPVTGPAAPTFPASPRYGLGRVTRAIQTKTVLKHCLTGEARQPIIKLTLTAHLLGHSSLARPSASPPPRVLARPCRVRSTAVLTRRGSRVPRPGACVHTHAHARAHPDAPGAPAPLRFPAAPRRPGPHLRWR